MNYIPNTDDDRAYLLKSIGQSSIGALFKDIPASIKEKEFPDIPSSLSEIELAKELNSLSGKNDTVDKKISFLGAGSYNHFIPSAVKHITSRSEFYTAYTPYQPEMSQGILQAIYEYQTMICRLTGMDATNASHYDGAMATAEAALMACNFTKRKEIIVSKTLHPEYRRVLKTIAEGASLIVREIDFINGATDLNKMDSLITNDTACAIIQNPNFFGCLENVFDIGKRIHDKGGLFIVNVDPISLGILKKPSEYGADIVTAEGQSLGNQINFGGPYLGIIAVKKDYTRMLPGRIVGLTSDHDGKRGFVLTLQTREQHIRREKATSNICSNESLCSIASAVYMAVMGKSGLSKVAGLCLERASYAKKIISGLKGYSMPFNKPIFKEFVVKMPKSIKETNRILFNNGIIGGLDLGRYYKGFDNHALLCFTEMNTKEDIDKLVSVLNNA